MQVTVTETNIQATALHQADELFMTNALVGIQSVSRLDQTRFDSTSMAHALRSTLLEANRGEPGDA
jgi:branched-subunit amino acid aminotransferase/4-amino-4-deoxychorismate lyase